jgi:predicted nucleic acid-binding protein
MAVYVDANVIVYAALHDPDRGNACAKFLHTVQTGKTKAWTSVLTLAETHHALKKRAGEAAAQDVVRGVLSLPITLIPVELAAVLEGLHQCAKHNLQVFDAIHAASARIHGIETIVTYDKDFDRTDLKRVEP